MTRPRLLRDATTLLLLAVVPAMLSAWLHPRRPEWSWRRPEIRQLRLETVARWENALWVDARKGDAYANAHVPGAILLNEDDWERLLPAFLADWQPDRPVVVYCDTSQCDASREVAMRLQHELHLTDVFVLEGGWDAWRRANP